MVRVAYIRVRGGGVKENTKAQTKSKTNYPIEVQMPPIKLAGVNAPTHGE